MTIIRISVVIALIITVIVGQVQISGASFNEPSYQPDQYQHQIDSSEIISDRTINSKTHDLGGGHYAWDGTIGAIHYEDAGWQEIDNIFEPAVAPWDWEMLHAGYHIRVKEDFTAGQIIEFEKQGETVQLQPMALEWTNALDQIQPIAMPVNVSPIITNPVVDLLPAVGMTSHQGTIRWNDAYGDGLDFEWKCSSTRLMKVLEIENLSKLTTPAQYILDGGNPVLRLNLIFDPSDIDIYVDGSLWDKKAKKQTFDVIEFRKGGEILWGFMPLRYWGSGEGEDNEGQSIATLEKRGNKLYISIRVPYDWLQSAVYPVFIDVDVDEYVAGSAGDADERQDDLLFGYTAGYVYMSSNTNPNLSYVGGFHFPGVNISQGSIIGDGCYLAVDVYSTGYDDPLCDIYLENVDSADDFAATGDLVNRAKTEHFANWEDVGIGAGFRNSPEMKEPIQDVISRLGWESGNDICCLVWGTSAAFGSFLADSYDSSPASAAKLHIEYSAVSYNIIVTSAGVPLYEGLAPGGNITWGLEFYTPTEFLDGVEKTGTVTLDAIAS